MKRFDFPLAGVLAWRIRQAEQAEEELMRLRGEHAKLLGLASRLDDESVRIRTEESNRINLVPAHLEAARDYALLLQKKRVEALEQAKAFSGKIAAQQAKVVELRRAAELLERLKTQKFTAWQHEVWLEEERTAQELFVARLSRRKTQGPA